MLKHCLCRRMFFSASQCSLQPRSSVGNYSSSRTGTYQGLVTVDEEEKRKQRNESFESTDGENNSPDEEPNTKRSSKKIKRLDIPIIVI